MSRALRDFLAELDGAFERGRRSALDGGGRRSCFMLCEHGKWLDAAWYAGHDAGVAELKRLAKAMAKHVDACPWGPPVGEAVLDGGAA